VSGDLVARRLGAQRLVGEPFASPIDAVRALGAVQSQDYAAAKWALGLRVAGALEADLDRLFDDGAILRTHMLRPTWHFVLPEDIRWIQDLTSPRVVAGLRGRHRQLELDEQTLARAVEVMGEAVAGHNYLTRSELGQVLAAAGIAPDGQRMPHLLAVAEHANVLTSGPRRGKQFTFALLEERAPAAPRRDGDEALRELVVRYFRSRGPAQVHDFAWWSGLSATDVRRGLDMARDEVEREVVDGQEYWAGAGGAGPADTALAHLVPNFDEYTVGYRDRSAVLDPAYPFDPRSFSFFREASPMGGLLSNIVTFGGRLRGAWSRALRGSDRVRVEVMPLAALPGEEAEAIDSAAERYARFLGRRLER
jgi:Winged helix DNA-binding domain